MKTYSKLADMGISASDWDNAVMVCKIDTGGADITIKLLSDGRFCKYSNSRSWYISYEFLTLDDLKSLKNYAKTSNWGFSWKMAV